ncbi:MAG: ammonium transporter [Chloroflexota bacterium]|nr:ammonium transporter [Chloroflexota bacterium]
MEMPSAWDQSVQIPINLPATGWILLASFLVFIMVPSIGLLEAGLTRRKNVIHALMKSLTAVGIMSAVFVLVGFSMAFNPNTIGGLLGNPTDFAVGNGFNTLWPVALDSSGAPASGTPLPVYLLFQTMFAAVTLALIGAGVPERMKFGAWMAYCLFVSLIVWPLLAHWVWSPNGILGTLGTVTGLLPGLGVRDFAGGVVVHVQAGVAGLAITLALGASIKRRHTMQVRSASGLTDEAVAADLEREGAERYGYSIPLAVIGTALLWFGWFGFNPGSSLDLNVQSAYAAVSTNLAASLGGVVALLMARLLDGRWDPIVAISGILGGLVMITPNAGYVDVVGATILGVLAGVVTVLAMKAMEKYLYRVDDPVGGFPVHGVNGLIGSIVVPIFANPDISSIGGLTQAGLLYGGGGAAFTWLVLQIIGVLISTVFVFATSYGFVKVASTFMPVRATVREEIQGLDLTDHGVAAQSEDEPVAVAAPAY